MMGLFDFWRKKIVEDEAVASSSQDGKELTLQQLGRSSALLELADRLAFGNKQIVEEVHLALRTPPNYFETFQDRLERRGIMDAQASLPWFALIDGLIEEELAWEIDWKESPDTIVWAVGKLINRKKSRDAAMAALPPLREQDYTDMYTHETLHNIHRKLDRYGFALACMDIDSDSYVLTVVPTLDLPRLSALAMQAGYKLNADYGG